MSPSEAQFLALASGGAALVGALVALALWLVVVPLGLRGIFEALNVDRSRAWIPFVNIATVYRLGGLSEYWLIALVLPPVSWLGAIMLFIASHRINRRLGRSSWYTVLAVVAWWVWALALGLQKRVDRSGEAEPVVWSAQQRPQPALAYPVGDNSASGSASGTFRPDIAETPVSAAGFIAPPPGVMTDAVAEPTRTPQPLFEAPAAAAPLAQPVRVVPVTQAAPVAPPVPAAPVAPPVPAAPVAQPAAPALPRVEFPLPADDAASVTASAPPSAVAPPVPESAIVAEAPEAPEAPASVAPEIDDDDDATIISSARTDATVISPRRRKRWWVQTTMGARVELTGSSAILGRRPSPHPLYPGAQLIAVTDDALSVSATHAVLEFVGGEWHVTDLGSTNGVWLIGPDGGETELGAKNRARVTPQFVLGELGVKVVQGA
jgi:hypothetical protein